MKKMKIITRMADIRNITKLLFIAVATVAIHFSTTIQPASAALCEPTDVSCPGTDAYCDANPADTANCTIGSATWCEQHDTHPTCVVGHPDYCALDTHAAEPICTVGNSAWCNSGFNPNNENCAGTEAFCDIHPADVSCPGSQAWCGDHQNRDSYLCPGSADYCELHEGQNDPSCPGTVSYCEKYPYDQLCAPIGSPGTNQGTPYSVYETSKKTGIGTVLCNGIYYLKSNIALPLALLCMIGVAILAMINDISWDKTLLICVGIAGVFGASQLSEYMGNNVAEDNDAITQCLTDG